MVRIVRTFLTLEWEPSGLKEERNTFLSQAYSIRRNT
jgi:hypothetical protein